MVVSRVVNVFLKKGVGYCSVLVIERMLESVIVFVEVGVDFICWNLVNIFDGLMGSVDLVCYFFIFNIS